VNFNSELKHSTYVCVLEVQMSAVRLSELCVYKYGNMICHIVDHI